MGGVFCIRGLLPPLFNPMITNPFVNRLAVIVLMFAVYAAGVSGGRTSLSTMNWSSPSLDVGAISLDIWKAIFDLVCLKQL